MDRKEKLVGSGGERSPRLFTLWLHHILRIPRGMRVRWRSLLRGTQKKRRTKKIESVVRKRKLRRAAGRPKSRFPRQSQNQRLIPTRKQKGKSGSSKKPRKKS